MRNERELFEMAIDVYYEMYLDILERILNKNLAVKIKTNVQNKTFAKRILIKSMILCVGAVLFCIVLAILGLFCILIID